ncbi:MAG: hypothetical protein AAF638_03430 [Pseudomonadota bacterium]
MAEEEEENYWPGYVDALSTMTMVLTFVMMILGIAVFILSQNVSKILINQIVESLEIEILAAESKSTEEIIQEIVEAMEGKSKVDTPVEAETTEPPAPATAEFDGTPPPSPTETEEESEDPPTANDAFEATSQVEADIREQADTPIGVSRASERIVLRFKPQATRLDDQTAEELRTFVAQSGALQNARRIEIQALANAFNGTLSEARKSAYYRAMLVRERLLQGGLSASQIAIRVEDIVSENQEEVVEIEAQ